LAFFYSLIANVSSNITRAADSIATESTIAEWRILRVEIFIEYSVSFYRC